MRKAEFEEYFRTIVLPGVATACETDGVIDQPARQQAWVLTIDAGIKDGSLPARASQWSSPRWLYTAQPAWQDVLRMESEAQDARR